MSPAVVIPVHKALLTTAEASSLRQVVATLGLFPIVLVAPQSLSLHAYHLVAPDAASSRFGDQWFQGFRQHQRLMISEQFYRRFASFSHLLVYHLDSWIFRDELLQWCQEPYDYIGAPWRSGYDADGRPQFKLAGNGGFSLRRVEAFIRTLSMFDHRRYRAPAALIRELRHRRGVSRIKHFLSLPLKSLGFGNSLRKFHQSYAYTEDKFWASSAGIANPDFRVAPVDVAMRFAFEASPEYLWESLNHKLPFGCHAWRYDQAFWCEVVGLARDEDFCPHDEHGKPLNPRS